MARYLPRCVGGATMKTWDPRVVQYLTSTLGGRPLGRRNERELRTIAEALDLLLEGRALEAGDILMGRFSSVELSASGEDWAVAQHLELIPQGTSGSATDSAKRAAMYEELLQSKLRKTAAPRIQLLGRGEWRGGPRDTPG